MKGSRTRTQFRVSWEREGHAQKVRIYFSRRAADDMVGRLTSPEPWRFYGTPEDRLRDGDDLVCCSGADANECCCGGVTVREQAMAERGDAPPLEYVRLESRTITTTAWVPAP